MLRFIFTVTCAVLISSAHAVEFPVSRPTLQQGEMWVYRTVDLWTKKETARFESVFAAEDNGQLVFRNKDLRDGQNVSTIRMSLDQQPCRTMQGSSELICAGMMRFPLTRLGESWSYKKLPWRNGKGYFDADCATAATESIEVPAGKFEAIRIDCKGFWTRVFDGSGSGRIEESMWYAPSVKRFVRYEFSSFAASGQLDSRSQTDLVEYRTTN